MPGDIVIVSEDRVSTATVQQPEQQVVQVVAVGPQGPAGSGGGGSLDSLSDVTITAPSNGHHLRYSGTEWTNALLTASDISSGTFSDARISQSSVSQHQSSLAIAWGQLTGTPVTFPPSSHTHPSSEITDLSSAVDLRISAASIDALSDVAITSPSTSQVLRWGGASWANGSVAYSELTGVPGTFPPSAHTHTAAEITNFSSAVDTRISASSIDVHSDVITTTPLASQYLRFNGTNWVNSALNVSDASVGTLSDSRLSAEVMLLGTSQNVTAAKTFTGGAELRFLETTSPAQYVGLRAPAAITTDSVFTLPTGFPASTQCLTSTSTGAMGFSSFVPSAGGASNGQIQYRAGESLLGGSSSLTWDNDLGILTVSDVAGVFPSFVVTDNALYPIFLVNPSQSRVELGQNVTLGGTWDTANPSDILALVSDTCYIGPYAAPDGSLGGCSVQIRYGRGNSGADRAILVDGASNTIACPLELQLSLLGKGIKIKEGTNARMGVATLVAGTVIVSNNTVTSTSRIFLTGQNSSGTHGELTVSARTAGVGFTISSSSALDTRQVAWLIVDPAP